MYAQKETNLMMRGKSGRHEGATKQEARSFKIRRSDKLSEELEVTSCEEIIFQHKRVLD